MVLIPAGEFQMGDVLDGYIDSPVRNVQVAGFYMTTTLTPIEDWNTIRSWAEAHEYTFDNQGSAFGNNHPVNSVNWYDVVKWCNARSEIEGRTPVYYTDSSQDPSKVYRVGRVDLTNACVHWAANGYRLPTEAEWEKAARGGLVGKRYPNGDSLSTDEANFNWSHSQTTPVRNYKPNGFGLYDMAGNLWQWIWDRYANYELEGTISDPRGSDAGITRGVRGATWRGMSGEGCKVAYRGQIGPDLAPDFGGGFRVVRKVD
jgi:formylglycine-generating enzyme required for sulfatase activity